MADPPRLAGQPPPLPPSLVPAREPFPPADDRAPDTVRLGSPLPRPPLLPAPDPLTEGTALLLRQELAVARELFREALPTQPALPALPALPGLSGPPVSARTRPKAAVAALIAGKYTAALALGGPTLLRIVAKAWPQSAPVILPLLEALGV